MEFPVNELGSLAGSPSLQQLPSQKLCLPRAQLLLAKDGSAPMPTPASENCVFNNLVLLRSSSTGPGGSVRQDRACLLRYLKADALAPAEWCFQLPKCARPGRD